MRVRCRALTLAVQETARRRIAEMQRDNADCEQDIAACDEQIQRRAEQVLANLQTIKDLDEKLLAWRAKVCARLGAVDSHARQPVLALPAHYVLPAHFVVASCWYAVCMQAAECAPRAESAAGLLVEAARRGGAAGSDRVDGAMVELGNMMTALRKLSTQLDAKLDSPLRYACHGSASWRACGHSPAARSLRADDGRDGATDLRGAAPLQLCTVCASLGLTLSCLCSTNGGRCAVRARIMPVSFGAGGQVCRPAGERCVTPRTGHTHASGA